MLKGTILLLVSFISFLANAQNIIVPSDIYFADQHLRVNEGGRREIQRQVDALTRYPTYFQSKVDRADTYFPIVERIFREEGLPDDFKYLSLQESGLTSDAVSTSNAVGFWQFKKEAASDLKLQINQDVDERKHIIQSTRGAARYLVKHNNVYYKNWHNTLLSYNLGLSGAKSYAKPNDANKKEMDVTERTHTYILTFLAHKVAFSNFVGRNPTPTVLLQEMTASAGKSFRDIALETQTDEIELQKYNKWLSGRVIPYDKSYTILIPVTNPNQQVILASNRTTASDRNEVAEQAGKREFRKQNNLKVIIARRGDTKDKLAAEADMPARRFLMFNDMYSYDPIVPGEAYYLEMKHSKADVPYHAVKQGETIHQVAQQYGVKVRSLLFYNRVKATETLAEGRLLWMQRRRPSTTPIEFQKTYPENTPAPANPGILAQGDDPVKAKERSAENNSTHTGSEDKSLASALENRLNKWFGVKKKPQKVQEVEVLASPETSAPAETEIAATPKPETTPAAPTPTVTRAPAPAEPSLDVAITQTNEEVNNTEDSLSENIDKQIEPVNKPETPLVYSRTKTAEPVAEPAASENTTPAQAETKPTEAGTKTTAETTAEAPAPKPAVKLREPVAAVPAKKTSPVPVYKEPAKTPAQPIQNPGVHVVAKGETLYAISKMYQVSPDDLKTWNDLGEMPLAIGQNLKVVAPPVTTASYPASAANKRQAQTAPAPAASNETYAAASGPVSHTVSAGESMYQISRKYGVTIKEIMEWNNKADFNVSPGEKLKIKPKGASRN